MRLLACVLLAVAARAEDEAAKPAVLPLLYGGYHGLGYGLGYYGYPYAAAHVAYAAAPTVGVVPTLGATPVAVGGYKAVAGDNGGLKGAVHEVPGLYGAPALQTQESAGDVSLTTGTGAYAVTGYNLHPYLLHGRKKREAEAEPEPEADPWYYYSGLGYGHGYGYGLGYRRYGYAGHYGYRYPYTYGHYGLGYGARYVAHSGGATHIVAKRSADAEPEADAEADPEADPWYYYSGLGYGHGYGLGHYGYAGHLGYRSHYGYSGYYGYPYSYGYGLGHYGYYGK